MLDNHGTSESEAGESPITRFVFGHRDAAALF